MSLSHLGLEWTCVGILRGLSWGLFWDVYWIIIFSLMIIDTILMFWFELVDKIECYWCFHFFIPIIWINWFWYNYVKLFEGLYSPSCDKPFVQIVILRLRNGNSNCEYVINWTCDEWWNTCVLRCVY